MSESATESQRSGAQRNDPGWLDRLEQVDRHVASTVKKMVRDLQDLASAAEDEAVGQLLTATARVDSETTQNGILTALLEEGQRFASRTAFFLTRPGEVRGWAGRGFSAVDRVHLDYDEGSAWARIASRTGTVSLDAEESAAVCRSLGAAAGGPGALIPFVLRGQLGGVLFADRPESEGALGIASLQLLTYSAALTVETAALRGAGSSPTLRFSSETESPVSLWQPPATEASAAVTEGEVPGVGTEEPGAEAEAAAAAAAVAGAAAAIAAEAEADETEVEAVAAEAVKPEVEAEATEIELEPVEVEAAEPEAAEVEVAEEAEEVAFAEPAAEESAAPGEPVDFEMVTAEVEDDLQAAEAIEAELEPEPELEDTSDLWAVEEESAEEEEDDTFVGAQPAAEPAAEPAIEVPPGVGQETVRLDIAALQDQMPAAEPATEEETAKLPQWEVEAVPEAAPQEFELEPEPEPAAPAYEIEPEPTEPIEPAGPAEPVTTPIETPDFSEDATFVSPPRDATVTAEPSPMAGGYVPPAPSTQVTPPPDMPPPADLTPPAEVTPPAEITPPAEVTPPPPSSGFAAPPAPKPEASGSTQVVPPTDIQGPGSAFGSAAPEEAVADGEGALHEEARRLARLLVSEIKLYNEEIIEEGRRSGNIYDRLKDDIDRSRQMYEERIDPRLLESGKDYFRMELVQRLAGGDERLLGY